MNNRNLDTAKLIPLGVLVAKCISVYKLSDINPPSTVMTSAAEHVIPHLMTVLNTNAWAELQCGRSPCSQQFLTARKIFIKQLNNVVNMVVKSVPPRPNLNVAFHEIKTLYIDNGYVAKPGIQAAPKMEVNFNMSSFIL